MKIKDLPRSVSLGGVKVRTPDGRIGYWRSQWLKGVWLEEVKGSGKVTPVFVEDLKETLEWEILDES